ncbi:MAG TPA: hypothetical protein DCM28_13350 [Phycisphaerales bacterium]|nr:hypothetical protein [Phycisphaerales bacterium]HCD31342.1 hypothetical protein [Phycisphaerales bacterium]
MFFYARLFDHQKFDPACSSSHNHLMIGMWIGSGICVALILLIGLNWKRQYLFVLTITEGKAQLTHGKVDGPFIEDVNRICELFSVREGVIKAVAGRKGVNILCDGPIKAQQRAIQNAMNHPL